MLETCSNSPYYKNSKNFQRFPKIHGKKVGTTTILKCQQNINLKNHLIKWKNGASDKTVLGIIENELKLDLIDTPKPNSKFAFPLLYEKELIEKRKEHYLTGKNIVVKANVTENKHLHLEYLPDPKRMGSSR